MPSDSLRLLAPDFIPTSKDVICGRGKQFQHHAGNRRFKELIRQNVEKYLAAETKPEKTMVIINIVSSIRRESPDGGFVDKDATSGRWYEIGDALAREKVGHAMRFFIKASGNCGSNKESAIRETKPLEQTRPTKAVDDKKSKLVSILGTASTIVSDARQGCDLRQNDNISSNSIMDVANTLAALGSRSTPLRTNFSERFSTRMEYNREKERSNKPQKQHHVPNCMNTLPTSKSRGSKNDVAVNDLLCKLDNSVKRSQESQLQLEKYDREVMGLHSSHSVTMRASAKSRKKILKLSRAEKKKLLKNKTTGLFSGYDILKNRGKIRQCSPISEEQGQCKRARTTGATSTRIVSDIASTKIHSSVNEDFANDPQKEIDLLMKEKEALLSALAASTEQQEQEAHKRIILNSLLRKKAALGSALAKTDAALLNGCAGPDAIMNAPPTQPMNLSYALLTSASRKGATSNFFFSQPSMLA